MSENTAESDQTSPRSGIHSHPGKEIVRCHRCGRPTARGRVMDEYVFGAICGRADCQRVEEGLSDRFRCHEMSVSLPVEGWMGGKPSCWSPDGEVKARV